MKLGGNGHVDGMKVKRTVSAAYLSLIRVGIPATIVAALMYRYEGPPLPPFGALIRMLAEYHQPPEDHMRRARS